MIVSPREKRESRFCLGGKKEISHRAFDFLVATKRLYNSVSVRPSVGRYVTRLLFGLLGATYAVCTALFSGTQLTESFHDFPMNIPYKATL